jgi:hypothetical protein
METAEYVIRWTAASLLLGAFLLVAAFNAWVAWRIFIEDTPEGPSVAPIFFGLIGAGGVLIMPVGTLPQRLCFSWIPLLLDCGCLPYLLYGIWYEFIKKK